MIRAVIFDLDGTLVQTEKLKALSYARAAMDLCPEEITEEQVLEAFKAVVGLPRRDVAMELVERFDLEQAASARMEEFGVDRPWQAFVQVRLGYYEEMIQDPALIRDHRWPHNLEVLDLAVERGCKLGLATMSGCQQANRVLQILNLQDIFDFTATRDDVTAGKPDPEIYQLVARELQLPPGDCLVLEDSPSGVRAAVAAGMACIAVATSFTLSGIRELGLLEERWIVEESGDALQVVQDRFELEAGSEGS